MLQICLKYVILCEKKIEVLSILRCGESMNKGSDLPATIWYKTKLNYKCFA